MEPPRLSVLVLSRRRPERLRACLRSILAQTPPAGGMEVRVLANGCPGTAALVRDEFPGVHVLELPENIGCVRGRNRISAETRSPYLAFLDDDGELRSPEILAACVEAAERDPRTGVVSMGLLNAVSDEPTGWRRTLGQLPYPCYHASFAGGACVMRRAAFEAAGRYCEGFDGFGEEFDLAVRLYASGWAVLHFPAVFFHHHVEKSDEDWRRQVSEGYAHLQYTLRRLYPRPWRTVAAVKALAVQVAIDVRYHGGRHVLGEIRKSLAERRRAAPVAVPVPVRALELLYYAKYVRVTSWEELERAPRGLLRRVLFLRLSRKRRGVPKLDPSDVR